jgi:predicted transcriptional regulator
MSSLSQKSLEEIFHESVFATPAVSIRVEDSLSDAAILLPHYLETLTDSLVVTDNDKPVGIIGGIELLDSLLKTATFEFLSNTKIGSVMCDKLVIIDAKSKFADLIKQWSQTRRAFALIPNQHHGYSVISARKILDIGISFNISTKLSLIPKKQIITFDKNDSVKQIIQKMFDNKTRKLVLANSKSFINDRIIIQKLSRDLDCLKNGEDFLNMKSDIFSLDQAEVVSDDLSISEACKIMQSMKSPYLLTKDRVISPWDILMHLHQM